MKTIMLLLAVFLAVSCGQKEVEQGKEKSPKTISITNRVKPVQKTEVRKAYHKDGETLWVKTTYIKGTDTKHGEKIVYYPNGKIERKIPYKDGELHGEAIIYYKDGEIAYKGIFKDGKLNGGVLNYYESGTIWTKATYKEGLLMSGKYYKSNGD